MFVFGCCSLVQDKGLPVGLLLMMQHLVELSATKRAAAIAAAAAAAGSPGKKKKGKKQAAAVPEPSQAAGGAEDDQESWLPELMASLCEKVRGRTVWLTICFGLYWLACWYACVCVKGTWWPCTAGCYCAWQNCSQLAKEEITFHICTSG
jgi:hypothetical protein